MVTPHTALHAICHKMNPKPGGGLGLVEEPQFRPFGDSDSGVSGGMSAAPA
jgi:hypothetical protein